MIILGENPTPLLIQSHEAGFQMPEANPNSGPDNKTLKIPLTDSTDPNFVAGFDDKATRRGLLRKVYSTLSVSNLMFRFPSLGLLVMPCYSKILILHMSLLILVQLYQLYNHLSVNNSFSFKKSKM